MSMKYTVVIEKSHDNYAAYVPDLPGCVVPGRTREETLTDIAKSSNCISKACASTASLHYSLKQPPTPWKWR